MTLHINKSHFLCHHQLDFLCPSTSACTITPFVEALLITALPDFIGILTWHKGLGGGGASRATHAESESSEEEEEYIPPQRRARMNAGVRQGDYYM